MSFLLMKVLLIKDVPGLGSRGQIVDVSEGYAANYLFRRKLAIPANKGIIRDVERKQKLKKQREDRERYKALELKEKLDGLILEISRQAGESGKLFSAITRKDIAEHLHNMGFDITKKQIELKRPIKLLGDTPVRVKIFKDIYADIIIRAIKM